jgi:hypothetical protein
VKTNRYFVEFTEYSGFGQLTVTREFFKEWADMLRFKRQLRVNQVIDYGEIQSQAATAQKAAA